MKSTVSLVAVGPGSAASSQSSLMRKRYYLLEPVGIVYVVDVQPSGMEDYKW